MNNAQNKETIDDRLLDRRNSVAHGEFLDISDDEYAKIHESVLNLLEQLRKDVEDAATGQNYERNLSKSMVV